MSEYRTVAHVYAVIYTDESGDEAIAGFRTSDGNFLPLICTGEPLLSLIRDRAKEGAREYGQPVELVRFSARESVEVIGELQ